MSNFNSFKINNPAFEAVQKMQNSGAIAAAMKIQESTAFSAAMKMETSGAFAAVRELQKTLEAVRAPLDGATAMLEEYHKTLAPIRESLNLIHSTYAPIFEATKTFNALNMKGLVAGLKASNIFTDFEHTYISIRSIHFGIYKNLLTKLNNSKSQSAVA